MTVNPATLMITASSATMAYGSTPPTITAAYSGLVAGDTAASLTTPPTCSTTADVVEPGRQLPELAARVPLTRTTSSATWRHGPGGHRRVVVTASSDSMTYGGSTPSITPVVLGLRERRQRRVAHHGARRARHGGDVEPGGQLPQLVLGGRRPQLHLQLRHGSVQVNPAPLTIAASSVSMTYGGSHAGHPPAVLGLRER